MHEDIKVYLYVIGSVPEQFTRKVLRVLQEFYENINNVPLPSLVEVYVYENTKAKLRVLEEEAISSGVLVVGDYVTLHEAWRGWPRIHVDYEKTRSLKPKHLEALLIHEAVHSVLHGSPLYYLVTMDPELIEAYGYENALKLVYTASTIVKDLEVHKFLVDQGCREQVKAYMEYIVERQLKDLECRNLLEKLQLAKLITPLTYVKEFSNLGERLPSKCREDLDKIIQVLEKTIRQEGDLSQKTYKILQGVARIVEQEQIQ